MKCAARRVAQVQDAAASGGGSCCFRSGVWWVSVGGGSRCCERGRCVGEESVGKLLCGVNACRLAWNVPASRINRSRRACT